MLTPGPFNWAYFGDSFLARQMGCDLVQGSDLFVHDKHVFVKTTAGPQQVDVIYRRIDDEFLDPRVFNESERARRAGRARGVRGGERHASERPWATEWPTTRQSTRSFPT